MRDFLEKRRRSAVDVGGQHYQLHDEVRFAKRLRDAAHCDFLLPTALLVSKIPLGEITTVVVLAEGGSISEAIIGALHASLRTHFEALQSSQSGRPLYLLEHGLEPEALHNLSDAVRASLLSHPVVSGWWAVYPLPLLVAATEVGYVYRGTGTDFWPIFQERLGAASSDDRVSLSALFRSSAECFGLATPTDTLWNRAFCHIAWPVLHAILPIELHRPLAKALQEVRVHLDLQSSDEAIVAPVRRRALLNGGVRLIAWLEDQHTAAAVIRRFLDPSNQGEGSALSRIARDLTRDEAAKAALRDARKRQQALVEKDRRQRRRPAAIEEILAPLVLRVGAERLSLAVKIPQMEQSLRERTRDALLAIRWRALLWSQGRPVPGRNVFSDYPVSLIAERLPPTETPLFGDAAALPVSQEARDFLGALRVQTNAPLVFTDVGDEGDALQLLSSELSADARYILLVAPEQRPPTSAESLGRIAGLRAFRVDASVEDAASWLGQFGLNIRRSAVRLSWIGSPELEQHRPNRRFARGDYIAFILEAGANEIKAELVAPDGSRTAIAATGQLIGGFSADQVGSYLLRYGAGEFVRFDVASPLDDAPLIAIALDAGTGSIADLADRQVTLRFDSGCSVQDAAFELCLSCDGRETARAGGILPDTPCRLGEDDEIWDALLTQPVLERLLGAKAAELSVVVRGLSRANFRFEQQTAPFAWEQGGATLRALDEAGELNVYVSLPSRPYEYGAGRSLPDRDVALLRAGREAPLSFGGLCQGPIAWRASEAPAIARPERLLRQFDSNLEGGVGGGSVADALVAWSGASVDHPVTQFRRGQVVRHLQAWMVEQFCGPEWAKREQLLGRRSSGSLARAFLNACATLGVGYADVKLTQQQRALLDRILLRLIDERGLTAISDAGPFCEDAAIAFDTLFNDAYEMLAERIESIGDHAPFDPDQDIDVGEASDAWERALAGAGSGTLLTSLADLLRPLDAAERLSAADFDTMLPEDVIDLMDEWISRNQPQHHARSWNRDLVESAFWLFAKPQVAARLAWRAASERLLADRFSARALRYAALRSGEGGMRQ